MDKIFEWFLPIKKDDGMVLRGIRVGETAPKVRMHLIDDSGKGADITGVDAVSVIVERSDGMKVALTLSTQAVLCFSPAVVELSFEDARLSAVAGLCTGVIDFYSGKVRMTSARFRYNVEPGIDVSDDDVAQDPEYSMFVGAMTDLAMLNKEVSEAESARNVFEEYNPEKEYFKGNKVAYAGSSYVLVAESAIGTSPTDADSWLCVAEAGSRCFGFPYVDINVGKHLLISFDWGDHNKEDYPGIDEWRASDILMTANGKVLKISAVIKMGAVVKFVEVLCIADLKGESGESVFISDENGNVSSGNNHVGCMAYYIKSIDFEGKKIYLSKTKVTPVISTDDNTDDSFETPNYDMGDIFSIVNKNHYHHCGTVMSVSNNVVSYDDENFNFSTIIEDADGGIADYTFRVYNKPDIGVVAVTKYAFATGSGNKALGAYSSAHGGGNVADGFYSFVEGLNNYAAYGAHAEGNGNKAIGNESHVEGHGTKATGGNAHAEGQNTTASGGGSHAEGMGTRANGSQSHAEGMDTFAMGAQSHAEGVGTQANAFTSHAEGNGTVASAAQSHAEGYRTVASGQSSHAEGQQTEASGTFSHAQGIRSYAKGYATFTSGADVEASGDVSVAMGKSAKATGRASMAVGESVEASASQSMALGHGVVAKQQGQVVIGRYNADDSDAVFIVGNGTSSARKNVFVVKKDGRIFVNGVEFVKGAMVFKGVVEGLPTSAKENDVYTVSTWKKAGTFVCSAVLNNNSIVFSEWNDLANHLYSDVQSNYGCSYKLVIGGISYVYTDCGISGAGDWGFDMVGHTDDVGTSVTVPSGTTIELYSLPAGASAVNKSYIYRGGEWIPLFG